MIVSFRHKGLERLYRTGNISGVDAQHAAKLRRLLTALDNSADPSGMDLPGARLHALKGDRKGEWAVWVSGNWRLVFTFNGNNAAGVDYVDYH
jgi:proteic killer suppression protein